MQDCIESIKMIWYSKLIEQLQHLASVYQNRTLAVPNQMKINQVGLWQGNCSRYKSNLIINPISHVRAGGVDSVRLQIIFFITYDRDAAEQQHLVTFPEI